MQAKCIIQHMKSLQKLLLVLCLGVVSLTTADAQQLRVGYVNMKEVLDNAPQVIAGRSELDREFRPRNDIIEADEVRATGMEKRLQQGDLTEEARARLEREVREIRRGINRQREDLRDELSFRRTEEVQKLEDQINLAVEKVAKTHSYDLILSSPVVFADPALDITDLILAQLQLEYEADQLEQAQP